MAKYARGKKSQAISDRSGLRVPYTQLKTTWDGLRVSPEDWEPKQPQLTPAKNVVDATALFNPRPDNDPENVTFFVGFNYDPFLDPRQRPGVGVHGKGGVGKISNFEVTNTSQTGVGGTAAVGSTSLFITIDVSATGVGGAGGTGAEVPEAEEIVIGTAGVGGTGAEVPESEETVTGLGGTASVGSVVAVEAFGWGIGTWSQGAWGDQPGSPHTAGLGGTGGVGTATVFLITTWGQGGYGEGTWN